MSLYSVEAEGYMGDSVPSHPASLPASPSSASSDSLPSFLLEDKHAFTDIEAESFRGENLCAGNIVGRNRKEMTYLSHCTKGSIVDRNNLHLGPPHHWMV